MSNQGRFEDKPLQEKHPNKIPIVIQATQKSRLRAKESFRFVSKPSTLFSHFSKQIRASLDLGDKDQLFFYNKKGTIIKPEATMEELEKTSKGEDGFVYFEYQEVESFGA